MTRPIYLTAGIRPLVIFPDTQAHLNGHTILTHTYYIYQQSSALLNKDLFKATGQPGLPDKNDPDYLGYLVFDIPGKLFSYYPEGPNVLEEEELKELIAMLSAYRDNPGVWPQV